MAESTKNSKKDISNLFEGLKLEPAVIQDLTKLHLERQKAFQYKIKESKIEALGKFKTRIESLKEAKGEMIKQYDEEIENYEQMVKNLTSELSKTDTKKKKPVKNN